MAAPNAIAHLAGWDNFYVIVGSSAGALIGLQFVVITLIASVKRTTNDQIRAFGTPTTIHFVAALLVSAVMSVPWESVAGLRATLGILGVVGTGYAVRVILYALNQDGYKPVLEDWIWHSTMPLMCYILLFVAAFLLVSSISHALFIVAIVALGLLFIGIHNSWDTVTYVIVEHVGKKSEGEGR